MNCTVNKSTKINVAVGCVEYLIKEVETKRRRLEISEAENNVMKNFFNLVEKVGGTTDRGYTEDLFYQAKKEFEEALSELESGK